MTKREESEEERGGRKEGRKEAGKVDVWGGAQTNVWRRIISIDDAYRTDHLMKTCTEHTDRARIMSMFPSNRGSRMTTRPPPVNGHYCGSVFRSPIDQPLGNLYLAYIYIQIYICRLVKIICVIWAVI